MLSSVGSSTLRASHPAAVRAAWLARRAWRWARNGAYPGNLSSRRLKCGWAPTGRDRRCTSSWYTSLGNICYRGALTPCTRARARRRSRGAAGLPRVRAAASGAGRQRWRAGQRSSAGWCVAGCVRGGARSGAECEDCSSSRSHSVVSQAQRRSPLGLQLLPQLSKSEALFTFVNTGWPRTGAAARPIAAQRAETCRGAMTPTPALTDCFDPPD